MSKMTVGEAKRSKVVRVDCTLDYNGVQYEVTKLHSLGLDVVPMSTGTNGRIAGWLRNGDIIISQELPNMS